MRRPRIGNKIADSLLAAASSLEDTIDEAEETYEREVRDGWRDPGDLDTSFQRELRVATEYIRDLALWYREKKGVE